MEFYKQEAARKNQVAKLFLKNGIYGTEDQKAFDVTYYKLDLKMDPAVEKITGSVTMRARALVDNFQNIELNFHAAMHVDSISNSQGLLSYVHEENMLNIQWPQSLSAGQEFELTVAYNGKPAQSGFGAFAFDTHMGQPMIWSLSEPYGARNWWPCKDVPADKADSVDVIITVPNNLIVASNGTLVSETEENEWKTFWWHEKYPIVTYLVSVAIYPYEILTDYYVNPQGDSMLVINYVFPLSANFARNEMPRLLDMLQVYSKIFGPYPFFDEKYGEAQFLWGGGMEHQTITSLGGFSEMLVAHELAHQWWGDMVTCESFHHIWLNEGFATYSEALYYEQAYGKWRYHQDMNSKQYFGGGTIYVYDPLRDNIFHGGLSYAKGAWVLHMLRHVVGDSVFFDILQTYYSDPRFQYKTATTEGFRDVCEQVSGMDLSRFFQQWIYEPGYPTYIFSWQSTKNEDSTFTVRGILDQPSDGRIFWMPVDVTIRTDLFDTTIVVLADDDTNSFSLTIPAKPLEVIVDKDNWVLNRLTEANQPELYFAGTVLKEIVGNGNNVPEAGETFELYLTFTNRGIRATEVVATISSDDPNVQIIKNSVLIGDIPVSGQPIQTRQPLEFSIAEDAGPQRIIFKLRVTSQNAGERYYQFTIPIGQPEMLFVAAEGKESESFFVQNALDSAAVYASVLDPFARGIPTVDSLLSQKAVIVNTGSKDSDVISDSLIAILRQFIDRGGKLLIAGQNLASYLNQTTAGQYFLSDYLGARFKAESFNGVFVKGLPDQEMTKSVLIRFMDDHNQKTQSSPDIIEAVGDAEPIMYYIPGNEIAGVRLVRGDARIIFLSFGLEAIKRNSVDNSALLLTNAVQWLTNRETFVAKEQEAEQPADYRLLPPYPNPFNPSTQIRFQLPADGRTVIRIYNTRGQLIRTLVNRSFAGGSHNLLWDGKDNAGREVASGLYFINIRAGHFVASQKVVKLQ